MTHRRRNRKLKSLYIWHRYAGIVAALLVLILSFTGIALNHTDRLKLDTSYVSSDWLLDWYGIRLPEQVDAFAVGDSWLLHVADSLFLDRQRINGHYSSLIGAIAFPHFLAVAADGQIILLTREGEIIERLGGTEGVPSGMRRLGSLADGSIVIQAAHGFYQTNRDFLKWQERKQVDGVRWIDVQTAPPALVEQAGDSYRSHELPLERVMLDLHSGRLFGSWGPWAMDVAAVLLVFLALSGLWLWGKQSLRKRQRRKRKASHDDHGPA